ncbi:hypothetical protein LTR94_035528, partial [Friedmanniomyces endolithicus]
LRRPAPGQLPRRAEALRRTAGPGRARPGLRRRHARHHRVAGPGQAGRPDARDRRRLPGLGPGPQDRDHLSSVGRARPRRTGLDLQLRGAAGLAGPDDPVQGEVGQAQGARL